LILDTPPVGLFTPGPTPIPKHILDIGARQLPYNRTRSFSDLTFEILSGLKHIFQTSDDVVVFTSSGTGAMEASVMGFLKPDDKVLIINGGSFGQRWVNLCKIHSIPYEELKLNTGKTVSPDRVRTHLKTQSCNVLLINAHETTSGVLYDIEAIGRVACELGVFFVVDAISTICADPFQMDEWSVDVAILSSQKALALPPGLSFVAFNGKAKARLVSDKSKSYYFDLLYYLDNQKRGQMPFTPAIGLFLMLRQRLEDITKMGLEKIIAQHESVAKYFRHQTFTLPFSELPERSTNAMTALRCDSSLNAYDLVCNLESQYKIFVAPSAADLKSSVFRVSHMGEQSKKDIDHLVNALKKVIFSLSASRKRGESEMTI